MGFVLTAIRVVHALSAPVTVRPSGWRMTIPTVKSSKHRPPPGSVTTIAYHTCVQRGSATPRPGAPSVRRSRNGPRPVRPPLCGAPPAPLARLHAGGDPDARARHRGEHRDLQRGEHGAAAAAPVRRSGAARHALPLVPVAQA